ncbi:MAG: hypothetical protein NT052_00165 [Candidatus Shapirobacteria bacterium]|nr:hypothetical protein [Candidatus Shapirobacteria bacterium]
MKKEQEFNQLENQIEKIINVNSTSENETEKVLSNLAHTPFDMDGKHYESVEGFWQGLKFPEGSDEREKIAELFGIEAKKAGRKAEDLAEFEYQGKKFKIGSKEHQKLIKKAITAKLKQNPSVLNLLLKTGEKKITHILKNSVGQISPDSKTIPGEKFCQILMDLREDFRKKS